MSRVIPGEGPTPSRLCVIGSHPGRDEERTGRPFVGVTGRELERYLDRIGLKREDVYLTNLVKERPLSDKDIPDAMIARWGPELVRELERVKPDLILACSALVCDWITLGTEWEGMGLEMLHGLSLWHPGLGCHVVPAYHPASGLHDSGAMLQVLRDVEAFGRAVGGKMYMPVDECPNPRYRAVAAGRTINYVIGKQRGEIGLDTEGSEAHPWSVQVSIAPGEAYLALAENVDFARSLDARLGAMDDVVYVHNALHDLSVARAMGIALPLYPRTVDTMVVAYQLCDEPQGLKALAWRHCGMRMKSYEEVVAPAQALLSLQYLEAAHSIEWGPAAPVKVFRNGVERDSKPWSINRRLEKMLADYRGVKPTDLRTWFGSPGAYPFGDLCESRVNLWERWQNAGKRKDPMTGALVEEDGEGVEQAMGAREIVERELGPMPQATLADIPFEDALHYACRDADAQIRVAPKLMARHRELFGS